MLPTEAQSSRYADAKGIRIHYNELGRGDAPVMLCIHGGGPGASSWSNFSSNAEAFSAHYRVLLVDLPRFGKSAKIAIEGPQLSAMAAILRDFLDVLGLAKVAIVGNSYGGQVALKLAIDFPERVGALGVIGSAPVLHSIFTPMPVEGVKLIANYYRGAGGPSLEKMRTLMQTLVFDPRHVTDEMVRNRFDASVEPETLKVNLGPPLARQDLTAEFPKVKAPTLVVWGMDDRAGALDIGLLMVRTFQDAEMHIFSRCGHWAQVEHAQAFNELVLAFFERKG